MHYLLIYLIWFFSAWCEIYLWYLWKRFIFNESPGDSQERQAWYNGVVEVSYTYIYLKNWVSIRKWACQLSQNKSKENWFHSSWKFIWASWKINCAIRMPDLWCVPFIMKGCALLKKNMYDLFMNDFSADSSELPEKSIVQFESKFKPSTKSLHWHYQEG